MLGQGTEVMVVDTAGDTIAVAVDITTVNGAATTITEIGMVVIGIREGIIIRILTITTIVGTIITLTIPIITAIPTTTTMTVDPLGSTSHFSRRNGTERDVKFNFSIAFGITANFMLVGKERPASCGALYFNRKLSRSIIRVMLDFKNTLA